MAEPVAIRRYRRDDAEALRQAALESVAEVAPWLPWCHAAYSLADSRVWLEHCDTAWEQGTEYNFAIVDGGGRYLGGCGLNQLRPEHRIANLGYWVRTAATKRGVATAAVRQLTAFAFRETTLVRLEIVVALGNVASHRVAAKSGALREGVAHDRLQVHGTSHDAMIYAVLRSRWASP